MRMSRILLLLVALIAGGLAAFLATRGGGDPVQPDPATPEIVQEARTQVLVATAPIGMGERLSAANVTWQDWPANAVLEDYISSDAMPEAMTDMAGTVARFEIFMGDPIRQQKLVRSDQGYLSAVLEQGMRGVSISVNAEAASGGFIVPNDHVDVLLIRTSTSGDPIAETILTNVRVLAINTRLGETGTTGAPADPANPRAEIFANTAIATLELNPSQAEVINNASQIGRLSLALRSIVDFKPAPGEADQMRRNAPIKIIRYGAEASVVAGTTPTPATVDPAAYTPPAASQPVTDVPAPLLD